MNNFTAIAKFACIPELRHVGGSQTPIVNPKLELITRYSADRSSFTIDGVAWGKVAEKLCTFKEGAIFLVNGQLNIIRVDREDIKESIASLKISEIVCELPELIPFNEVLLLGNVGQDVDAKWFESGKNNAKFSLAVRRSREDTDWFAIETWGDTAKVADRYVTKGSKIGIKGHLKIETWTDKSTGKTRSKPVIIGDRIDLAGKGGGESTQSNYSGDRKSDRRSTQSNPSPRPAATAEPHFDDIPF